MADNARVVVTRSGGPEVLTLEDAPMPQPGSGEVRVRVPRAGVAFADVMLQRGLRSSGAAPRVPGFDLVGEIDAVGPGSTRKVGERVAALTIFGSHARYVVVPEERLLDVPRELSPSIAACLPLNYLTAYQMLLRVAGLRAGDTVLVWAAAGGAGSAALELGRRVRACGIDRVIPCEMPSLREDFVRIAAFAESGALTPSIWAELPLEDAARAHEAIERRAVVGKIVLDCAGTARGRGESGDGLQA